VKPGGSLLTTNTGLADGTCSVVEHVSKSAGKEVAGYVKQKSAGVHLAPCSCLAVHVHLALLSPTPGID